MNKTTNHSASSQNTSGISASFPEFLWIWNQAQNLTTPPIHKEMATWLGEQYIKQTPRLLLQAFRASGKSTICGLFAAWALYLKPHMRIVIIAAEQQLATKMVRNVKHIIEHHQLIADLKPQQPEKWASGEFTVQRNKILRDPSVVAHGIGGNFTGSRADIIICDDVEVPNNCDTPKKRQDLRERLGEIDYVLSPNGTQIYIGTPHSYYSIYANQARRDIQETQAFLHDFKRLNIPVLNKHGKSAWKEKFSTANIALLKARQGPNKFASQMLLQPLAPRAGMLNPALLRLYEDELVFSEKNEQHTLTLADAVLLSSSCWWDPAFASAGDQSVVACVFCDNQGRYYLHDLQYMKPGDDVTEDNAHYQCRQVAHFLHKNYQSAVQVETNGIGKFLPGLLRRILEEEKIAAAVIERHSSENKTTRILTAFDALLAARHLHVRQSVATSGFMSEMREWDGKSSHNCDDTLDAVAGCINNEPIRLPRQFKTFQKPSWRRFRSISADTQFQI